MKEAIELDRSGWRVKKPSDPVTLTPLKPEEPAANLSAAVKTLKLDSGVPAADPSRPALEHCYSGEPEEEGIVVYVETNIVGFKHKEAQLNCSVYDRKQDGSVFLLSVADSRSFRAGAQVQ